MTPRSHLFPSPSGRAIIRWLAVALGAFLVVVAGASRAGAQRDARIRISVDTPAAFVGQTVRTAVEVEGMRDLAGYQLTLVWDTSLLRDIEIRVDEEYITSSGRRIEFLEPVWGEDRVTFLLYTRPPGATPVPGVDGAGVLIYADFEALEPGEARIELVEALLTDSENTPLEASIDAASVLIRPSRPIYLPFVSGG